MLLTELEKVPEGRNISRKQCQATVIKPCKGDINNFNINLNSH
jgi:hypothetical protein